MGKQIDRRQLISAWNVKCPACGGQEICRAKRTRLQSLITIVTGDYPYQCRNCGNRLLCKATRRGEIKIRLDASQPRQEIAEQVGDRA